jgi:hypothetical protein
LSLYDSPQNDRELPLSGIMQHSGVVYNAMAIVGAITPMVKQKRYSHMVISAVLVLLALSIWLALMREFRLDDSFITYRYARNLMRGWGLVYNRNEPVLSTTAPLYALLLAALSVIVNDFQLLGGLVGALCIGMGGTLIVALLPKTMPSIIRVWAGLVYVLSSPLWLALGMETPLWIMMVLAAVWLAQSAQWWQAGLLIGLAILTRPDAALPGALLGGAALGVGINALGTRRGWWFPALAFAIMALLPAVLFAVWAAAAYGSPFPATLAAKSAQAGLGISGFGVFVDAWGGLLMIVESLIKQSPLYIVIGLLAALGVSRQLTSATVILVLWGLLHLVAYRILSVAPYRWYYVPLLPAVIVLSAYGLQRVFHLFRQYAPEFAPYATVVVAMLPLAAQGASFARIADYFHEGGPPDTMLPIVDWQAYQEAGEWLNTHTASEAVIGVAEVGQVGFYADRTMTDYLGLLQPDVAALLKRGDLYSWLLGYSPDYLVFQRFGGKVGLALYNHFIEYDPWFVASYHEVAKFDDPRYTLGPVVIYQRTTPARHLDAETTSADFGPIKLDRLAVEDQVASGPTRVRLDWRVTGPLPANLHISVSMLDVPAQVTEPKFDGDYLADHWTVTVSTWHSLMLPNGIPPGRYPLQVSVGLIDGIYKPAKVGWIDIPPP